MEDKANEGAKIVIGKDKTITRKELLESKANFHKKQARLPFEEKIKILIELQKIARAVKGTEKTIWEI